MVELKVSFLEYKRCPLRAPTWEVLYLISALRSGIPAGTSVLVTPVLSAAVPSFEGQAERAGEVEKAFAMYESDPD